MILDININLEEIDQDLIIWNSSLGIRDFVTIGEIKKEKTKIEIYLDLWI